MPSNADRAVEIPAEERAGLDAAVARLRGDGLVAYPTETVWGLAARAESPRAVAALQEWKGRRASELLSILLPDASLEAIDDLGVQPSPLARALVEAFWPGPLTLVLPVREARAWPPGIAGEAGALGLRCSAHPSAAALARAAAAAGLGPLTATSLNRSGEPPVDHLAGARLLCGSGPDAPAVLDRPGAPGCAGTPSTVLDLTRTPPRWRRRGALADAVEARIRELASAPKEDRR